jgi:tetratricopeptide (TPR) repeat protein
MNAVFSSLRSKLHLLLVIALVLRGGVVWAQTADAQLPSSQERIARDLELIRFSEQHHSSPLQQAVLWVELALEYHLGAEFPKAEDAYLRALHLLKNVPSERAEYASTLDLIYGRLDDAESTRKQAIKLRQKLGNPAEYGETEVHLADIVIVRRQYKKAERLALKGLQTMESSPNPPRAGILSALITLTYARCSTGKCREGLMNAKQAVAFANKNCESEPVANGFALQTLGFAEWKTGALQDGERAMLQYQAYLTEAHRPAEAAEIHEQVTRITRQSGAYCQGCAVSVYSLSNTLR